MDRAPVRSSNIASIGYDEESQVLEIEFHNGGVYQYSGVRKDMFIQLMNASSKGRLFSDQIKDNYSTTRRCCTKAFLK